MNEQKYRMIHAQKERSYGMFHLGGVSEIYLRHGCHLENGGARFGVYAPHAVRVAVAGDFNGWSHTQNPLSRVTTRGDWGGFVPGVQEYDEYRYVFTLPDGREFTRRDPFAYLSQAKDGGNSQAFNIRGFPWRAEEYRMRRSRNEINPTHRAALILQVNPAALRREDGRPYRYQELGDLLIPYMKEMGYTFVQLVGILEHDERDPLGNAPEGLYAANHRYGTLTQFMDMVDDFHMADLGVILEWNPFLFYETEGGLMMYDGDALFEEGYPPLRKLPGQPLRQSSFIFPEMRAFYYSSVLFWMLECRVDAISVGDLRYGLSLSYQRGEAYIENTWKGEEKFPGFWLMCGVNAVTHYSVMGGFSITSDHSGWPRVTGDTDMARLEGHPHGLNFDFKHDNEVIPALLRYLQHPQDREAAHEQLRHALFVLFNERLIFALSAELLGMEGCSLYERMPGTPEQRRAQMRALYAFVMGLPGKKLVYLGTEIAAQKAHTAQQPLLVKDLARPQEEGFFTCVRWLHRYYCNTRAFYERDQDPASFHLLADFPQHGVWAYYRQDATTANVLVLANLSEKEAHMLRVPVPEYGAYRIVFHSGEKCFGGPGAPEEKDNGRLLNCRLGEHMGYPYSVFVTLPPYTVMYCEHVHNRRTQDREREKRCSILLAQDGATIGHAAWERLSEYERVLLAALVDQGIRVDWQGICSGEVSPLMYEDQLDTAWADMDALNAARERHPAAAFARVPTVPTRKPVPPKQTTTQDGQPLPKRGPGRPRKYPILQRKYPIIDESGQPIDPSRGRGRPRKVQGPVFPPTPESQALADYSALPEVPPLPKRTHPYTQAAVQPPAVRTNKAAGADASTQPAQQPKRRRGRPPKPRPQQEE